MNIWIVGLENNNWWCCNRSRNEFDKYQTRQLALESAQNEATLLMMKHWPKRDMKKAKIIRNSQIGFGINCLSAPLYIDESEPPRKTPEQVWVIEAPSRYHAIKLAQKDYNKKLISINKQ